MTQLAKQLAKHHTPVAQPSVGSNEVLLLLIGPSIALDIGAQLIVPPLPALLADAPSELPGNLAPVALPAGAHQSAWGTAFGGLK